MSDAAPADRVRTLLLRADNGLKSPRDGGTQRARTALEEARTVAQSPEVDPRVRELVEQRLATLDGLDG